MMAEAGEWRAVLGVTVGWRILEFSISNIAESKCGHRAEGFGERKGWALGGQALVAGASYLRVRPAGWQDPLKDSGCGRWPESIVNAGLAVGLGMPGQ
jgi:hypothetical protein